MKKGFAQETNDWHKHKALEIGIEESGSGSENGLARGETGRVLRKILQTRGELKDGKRTQEMHGSQNPQSSKIHLGGKGQGKKMAELSGENGERLG